MAQGVITGIRGLCSGLGPAIFGFIFYLFQIDLNAADTGTGTGAGGGQPLALSGRSLTRAQANVTAQSLLRIDDVNLQPHVLGTEPLSNSIMPGPPFAFGAALVLLALLVSTLIPDDPHMVIAIQTQRSNQAQQNLLDFTDDVERSSDRRLEACHDGDHASPCDAPSVNPTVKLFSSSLNASANSHAAHLPNVQHAPHAGVGARPVRSHTTIGFVTNATSSPDYAVLGQIDSDD